MANDAAFRFFFTACHAIAGRFTDFIAGIEALTLSGAGVACKIRRAFTA